MRTVFVCNKCGCGFLSMPGEHGVPLSHAGPLWQWVGAQKFGPNCGGHIVAKIITEEQHER